MAEGIIHYKRTLRDRPEAPLSLDSLGITPRDADRLNEAIGHYEKALRIEPELSMATRAGGHARWAGLGRFREAEAATRRCLDRLPQGHELRSNVVAQFRRCERLITLQDSSPRGPPGEGQARDAAETLEFAELCGLQGQRSPPHACTPRPSLRRRNRPGTSTPTTATGPPAPPRWPAAAAPGTGPGSAKRSGAVARAGPRVAPGRGRPLDRGAGRAVPPRIASWLPQVGASVGRSRPGRAARSGSLDKLPTVERRKCRTLAGHIDALIRCAQARK